MTIAEFREYFLKQYKVNISIMVIGDVSVYNKYSKESVKREGLDILKAYETISRKNYPKFRKQMQIEVFGETLDEGIDINMPTIKYHL
jgi:hypothetical protein